MYAQIWDAFVFIAEINNDGNGIHSFVCGRGGDDSVNMVVGILEGCDMRVGDMIGGCVTTHSFLYVYNCKSRLPLHPRSPMEKKMPRKKEDTGASTKCKLRGTCTIEESSPCHAVTLILNSEVKCISSSSRHCSMLTVQLSYVMSCMLK